MNSLVKSDKYGAINTACTTTNGHYVIKFISEAYTLKNNTRIDGQTISALIGIGNNNHCNRIS